VNGLENRPVMHKLSLSLRSHLNAPVRELRRKPHRMGHPSEELERADFARFIFSLFLFLGEGDAWGGLFFFALSITIVSGMSISEQQSKPSVNSSSICDAMKIVDYRRQINPNAMKLSEASEVVSCFRTERGTPMHAS